MAGQDHRARLAGLQFVPPGVISDIHGVPGREMLTAIIAGQRDPRVVAQMARTRMRARIPRLGQALDCSFFTGQHAFILAMMLASIGHLTQQVKILDDKIAGLCRPYERQIAQLGAIPGSGITTARDVIAGIGTGMSVFPAAARLCSRARYAPGVSEPAGKRKGKNATGRGSPCIGAAIGETAIGAGLTRTGPGARYRRYCTRMPKKKARCAIGRTRLVITRALLSGPGAVCEDLGTGCCERRTGTRRRVRSLECPGYYVTLEPAGPARAQPQNQPPEHQPANPRSRRHKPPPAAAARPAEV